MLLIEPLGTNFGEILIEIYKFSFKKVHLKMPYGKWRPFYFGLNMLKSDTRSAVVSITIKQFETQTLPAYPMKTEEYSKWSQMN